METGATSSKLEQLAHKMYDDYCVMVGGKAFNGDPLPGSGEFFADPTKEKQANAWRGTAKTAVVFILNNLTLV